MKWPAVGSKDVLFVRMLFNQLSASDDQGFSRRLSFYKSKVGYPQLRWRLLQCVSRSFFTDASHMLTFRAERWRAAANPEEDYGKMWRHYKISTSGGNETEIEREGGGGITRLCVRMFYGLSLYVWYCSLIFQS